MTCGRPRAITPITENMYFTEIDGAPYGVKPMNCVAHMLIYNTRQRSY